MSDSQLVSTEPTTAPASSSTFVVHFKPTGSELLLSHLIRVPNALFYTTAAFAVIALWNLVIGLGAAPILGFVGIVAGFALAPAIFAPLARETRFEHDELVLRLTIEGRTMRLAWADVVVRVVREGYMFSAPGSAAVLLPRRVLGQAEERILEETLAARQVKATRKPAASFRKLLYWLVGIVVFVTVYNLFQGPSRPRHDRPAEAPASTPR
jgi:hypothetical protein